MIVVLNSRLCFKTSWIPIIGDLVKSVNVCMIHSGYDVIILLIETNCSYF